MEGCCPFNQKMSMMSDMCWKCHSDESVINDEKGRWWVKGEKRKKEKKKMKERKNPFWTAACQWPTNHGRHAVLCCFWYPINKNKFKKKKNICAHVKVPLIHVRVRWIMETLKHPACILGWVARLFPTASPFKAWSRSVYSRTCYAYCQAFLPCLFLPFRSTYLHFSQNISQLIFSCVGCS